MLYVTLKLYAPAALTASMKSEIRQLTADVTDLQNVSVAGGSENNRQTGKHATTVTPPLSLSFAATPSPP